MPERELESIWLLIQNIESPFKLVEHTNFRQQWVSLSEDGNHIRLLVIGDEPVYAIEDTSLDFGLVLGLIGAHPFIRSQAFHYDNSDGSGMPLPTRFKTARQFLMTFISGILSLRSRLRTLIISSLVNSY